MDKLKTFARVRSVTVVQHIFCTLRFFFSTLIEKLPRSQVSQKCPRRENEARAGFVTSRDLHT